MPRRRNINSVGEQTTSVRPVSIRVCGRQAVPCREFRDPILLGPEERTITDDDGLGAILGRCVERARELTGLANLDSPDSDARARAAASTCTHEFR